MGLDPNAKGVPKLVESTEPAESSSATNPTGIFAAFTEAAAVPESTPVQPVNAAGMPQVHEVVFPSPDSAGLSMSEHFDALLNSLRSMDAGERVQLASAPPPAANSDPLQLRSRIETNADSDELRLPPSTPSKDGFTQLFHSLTDTPPIPSASPTAFSFAGEATRTVGEPTSVPIVTSEKAEPPPSSFTRLLRSLDTEARKTSSDASSATAMYTRNPLSEAGIAPSSIRSADAGGSESEVATKVMPVFTAHRLVPPAQQVAAPPVTDSLTQRPQGVPEASNASTPPFTASGAFTQLFRAMDSEQSASHAIQPQPQPFTIRVGPPPSSPASDGAFTKLFNSSASSDLAQQEGIRAPVESPASKPANSISRSASLTQMLSNLGSQQPQGQQSVGQQNSSAVFSASGQGSPEIPSGLRSTPTTEPTVDHQQSSFSNSLSDYLNRLVEPTPPLVSKSPAPTPGQFTVAYDAFTAGSEPVRSNAVPSAPPTALDPPSRPPLAYSQPVMASNSRVQDVTRTFRPPGVEPPLESPPPAGASEFTRIIQASSLREKAMQQAEQAPEAAAFTAAPAAPTPGSPAGGAIPRVPQFPRPNSMSPVAYGSAPAPHLPGGTPSLPNLSQPWMPAAPQLQPPSPTATSSDKARPMLPLVLILIIFFLLAILAAVIFLFKH
jgi:hypothetical protein